MYTEKSQFKTLWVPWLETEDVLQRYASKYIMYREKALLASKYLTMMHADGVRLSNQIKMRLMQFSNVVSAENEEAELNFLETVAIRIDKLDTEACEEIDSIKSIIFEADIQDYKDTFCSEKVPIAPA